MLRFAGFALDADRAELRGPDGEAIKLRPKTFALLLLLAKNPGRVLSKQELMTAIWPNIHVGEDSLFQCIREIRTALGDEKRQRVKSVSGRGYLFEADVSSSHDGQGSAPGDANGDSPSPLDRKPPPGWARLNGVRPRLLVALATICLAVGIAVAAPMLARRLYAPEPKTFAVMPIHARTTDHATEAMAASVTDRLTDGLSKIGNIHVLAPRTASSSTTAASSSSVPADYVLNGELQKGPTQWEFQARLIDTKSGQVQWSTSISVPTEGLDEALQRSRLTAGIGHPLALRINSITHSRLPAANSKIVVEQATALINRATRERSFTALEMLEKALAAKPEDVDLSAALAAQLLRGVMMVWYTPEEAAAVEQRAKTLLDHALENEPNYIPALEVNCRFKITTNQFTDSLVACEKVLRFEPWDGLARFHIGMAQLQLGHFEEALATFQRADSDDTPQVSRWTWLLGAGLTLVVMERYEEALPWLERSLAVTTGTGRTHLVIAAIYQKLGRHDEAKAMVAKALELRPGSNAINVALPPKNQSDRYVAQAKQIRDLLIAAGLPEP